MMSQREKRFKSCTSFLSLLTLISLRLPRFLSDVPTIHFLSEHTTGPSPHHPPPPQKKKKKRVTEGVGGSTSHVHTEGHSSRAHESLLPVRLCLGGYNSNNLFFAFALVTYHSHRDVALLTSSHSSLASAVWSCFSESFPSCPDVSFFLYQHSLSSRGWGGGGERQRVGWWGWWGVLVVGYPPIHRDNFLQLGFKEK